MLYYVFLNGEHDKNMYVSTGWPNALLRLFSYPIPCKYDILLALSSLDFLSDMLQVCSLLHGYFLAHQL